MYEENGWSEDGICKAESDARIEDDFVREENWNRWFREWQNAVARTSVNGGDADWQEAEWRKEINVSNRRRTR